MLFKLSNLNSNLALTLGYLNPPLNNSAQKNRPQEMVTQYACNKPASWPFNVKPSVAKKDLLSQSLEWYMHCVVLVTFAREPRKKK